MNIIVHDFDFGDSPNANSICVYELVKKINEKVVIFTTIESEISNSPKIVQVNNITVHQIPIDSSISKKKALKKWRKIAYQYIFKVRHNLKSNRFITIAHPIYLNDIARKLVKTMSIDWDIYYMDPYSFNQSNRFYKTLFVYRFIREISHLYYSRKIFLTNELFDQFNRSKLLIPFKEKFVKTGIPLLSFLRNQKLYVSNKDVKLIFIYSGMFYSKIRNPKEMFEFFENLYKLLPSLELHLYGVNIADCYPYFNNEIPPYIKVKGRIPKEILNYRLNQDVFLVNIGNTVSNQLPSKIMDYISTGNPILNFTSIKYDTSQRFLVKYPYKINISKDYNLEEVVNFIISHLEYTVNFNDIAEDFKSDTVEEIIKKIKRLKDRVEGLHLSRHLSI